MGDSAAICFCSKEYSWLLGTSRSAARHIGFMDFMSVGGDIAQKVALKCATISDEHWALIENEKGYVTIMIRHMTYREYKTRTGVQFVSVKDLNNLDDNYLHKNRLEAAILIKELRETVPPEQWQRLEAAYLDERTRTEMAEKEMVTPEALRQRLSRTQRELRKRLDDTGPPHPS